MITFKSAESALKSVYLNAVIDQLNTTINPFYSRVIQTTNDIVGKEVVRVVRKSLPTGISVNSTDDADLPPATSSELVTFRSPLKNLFGQISITDKALKASQHSEGAFVNLLNNEMEGLLTNAKLTLGRVLFTGCYGEFLRFIKTNPEYDPTVPVKNYVKGFMNMPVARISYGGTPVEINQAMQITNEKFEDGRMWVTITTPVSYAVNEGMGLSLTTDNVLTGLGAVVSERGKLYSIDVKPNPWLQSYRYEANNEEELTEELLQTAFDEVTERSGNTPDMIITSTYARRGLVRDLSSYRRNVDFTELEGGFKALSFNGVPVIADRFCPVDRAFLVNTKDFAMHQLGDWSWIENEGGNVLHQIPGKAAYSATLVKYAELMCDRPYAQGVINGIKVG